VFDSSIKLRNVGVSMLANALGARKRQIAIAAEPRPGPRIGLALLLRSPIERNRCPQRQIAAAHWWYVQSTRRTFTAVVERDTDTAFYVRFVPFIGTQ
jgi:hypothetical protein